MTIRDEIQESIDDYTLKTDEELINIITEFGSVEMEFHTADIECLIREKHKLEATIKRNILLPTGGKGDIIPDMVGICPSCKEEISRNGVFNNHNCKNKLKAKESKIYISGIDPYDKNDTVSKGSLSN